MSEYAGLLCDLNAVSCSAHYAQQEVMVDDVAFLEPGEIVPCNSIFLSGHNIKCDESAATGESDAIKKASCTECLALKACLQHVPAHTYCFVISGSKVLEGVSSYVVVAVGAKSFNGRIMMGASFRFLAPRAFILNSISSSDGHREYLASIEAQNSR